ncbi:MAG: FAD-binding oxidoreductase [Hyphomicrobiaceae bacterium]
MADIVVIGGGITGTAAAFWLASGGHRPVLLEGRAVAAMGSGWSLGGVRQSGRHPAELPLAQAAVALWPTLADRLGNDTEFRQRGNLRLARTEAEVEVIRRLVESQCALGLDLAFLPTTADIRAVAPALAGTPLAASLCPTDGHANPAMTTRAFAAAARRSGATIREGVTVTGIAVEGGKVAGVTSSEGRITADVVIVAAGIGTPALLAPLGHALPLSVQIVSVLQSTPLPPLLDQVLGVANADCAARQEVDGRLRFTSGVGRWPGDPARWSDAALAPGPGEIARLRALVGALLPAAADAPLAASWGGLIDLTPDALPVIDRPDGIEGLVVAAGFSGHGFGIGPITGALAADLALGLPPRLAVDAFRLDRFAHPSGPAASLTLHG